MRHPTISHCITHIAELQFLRELHFIEAGPRRPTAVFGPGCSSFGSCTSLRPGSYLLPPALRFLLQFLRELHFIEARGIGHSPNLSSMLQFLRELHFIEAIRGLVR